MQKYFKFLLSVLFSFIILFNFSYSEFGTNFELDCADCIVQDPVVAEPAAPLQINCGNGVFVNVPYACPDTLTQNPITQTAPVYTNPVTWNTSNPYQIQPINPTNNGGVSITCRGDGRCGVGVNWGGVNVTYNPNSGTQTTNGSFTPTNWGGNGGGSQTYNPAPIYTQPRIAIPEAPRIVCPINYAVNGQECTPNKKTCSDGSQINFYEVCTKTCWSGTAAGQKILENQACPAGSNTNQTYNVPVIYNTPVRPVANTTIIPVYWGGDRGASQTYDTRTAATTKVCKDGNTVYDYQICTRSCVDGTVINENFRCPATQTKHEVMTTAATNITNGSAKCNAVADIVNMVNTTGYFEYGNNSSLGKFTNSGNIGYGDNIYYSNTITNLEPNTKYYCRAIIVNKDGVYKGNIINFVTGANKKVYVSSIIEEVYKKEVISSSIKKNTTKKVVQKKVEVTCKDAEGNTDKLESGEKFLDMRLDNISGFISSSEISEYRLEYKNRSTLNLENVLIKIEIPEGMSFVSSTDGTESNGEILVKIGDVKAVENKIISFKLKGDKDLKLGKNIIVQANSSYDMLDEDGETISDENSVYSISTVTEKIVSVNAKASKENESFWSGWLFKFLLSLLLIIILFILGRNIYKKIIHKRHSDRILGHH